MISNYSGNIHTYIGNTDTCVYTIGNTYLHSASPDYEPQDRPCVLPCPQTDLTTQHCTYITTPLYITSLTVLYITTLTLTVVHITTLTYCTIEDKPTNQFMSFCLSYVCVLCRRFEPLQAQSWPGNSVGSRVLGLTAECRGFESHPGSSCPGCS